MSEIIAPSDPRAQVELSFTLPNGDRLDVTVPRPDFIDYQTELKINAEFRRMRQENDERLREFQRIFKRNRIAELKYEKALSAWEKRLRDPEVDDPGPEPEEPEREPLPESLTEREAERAAALVFFRHLLSAKEYRQIEKLTTAEILQAQKIWVASSEISLGESTASPTSSAESTEGRSEPTSSPEDGPSET